MTKIEGKHRILSKMADDFSKLLEQIQDQYRPKDGELATITKVLIKDLEAVKTPQNSVVVDEIITKAKKESYHDFLAKDTAFPIMDLVIDCTAAGLLDIARKAKNGDYDA